MECKGLLKGKPCETDKRVNNVFITQKGLDETKTAFSLIINEMDKTQHKIDAKEIRTTIKILK